MTPKPIYTPETLHTPAYQLRYSWSGWPSSDSFPNLPSSEVLEALDAVWETDGMRRLSEKWTPDQIQLTVSTTPKVSPTFLAARIKGRLQYALRKNGTPVYFSRKVSVRSVGDNHREEVENYISQQVEKSDYVDPRFKEFLQEFTLKDDSVDLKQPTATQSGRYWYNLHLVLVVRKRFGIADKESLTILRDWCLRIARKKGHGISRLSIMPDHLHLALRGNIEHSPEEIALGFLNNLAFALGQKAIWEFGYYAGTFGEYDMNAVREG